MDHGMNGKRMNMYSDKRDIEHHTHQETRSMDEEHTCETTILIFLFIYLYIILIFFTGNCIYLFVC